jgi:Listeria/Bacterioides repeat
LGAGGENNAENPSTYTVESEIALKNPSRYAYDFNGWWEGNTIPAGETGAKTFTAQWIPSDFQINYVLGGGYNVWGNPAIYNIESETINLSDPVKNGYTFAGWAEGGAIPAGSTGDKTFTAIWNAATVYQIGYELDGGINADGNPTEFTIESAPITLAAPAKTGYTFIGWTDSLGVIQNGVIPTGTTGSRTFYASWSNALVYNITYNLDGGTNHQLNPSQYTILTEYDLKNPAKTDHTFMGWLEGSSIQEGTTGDLTFTATWAYGTEGLQYAYLFGDNTKLRILGYTGTATAVKIPEAFPFESGEMLPVTQIYAEVFKNKTHIVSVDIPASVNHIGSSAFMGATSLTTVNLHSDCDIDTILVDTFNGCSSLSAITLPQSVELILDRAFKGTAALASITLPENLQAVNTSVFEGSGLRSISLPSKILVIQEAAFKGSIYLNSVTLPDGLIVISPEAFMNCIALYTVVIPKSVSGIGEDAFEGINDWALFFCEAQSKPANWDAEWNENASVTWASDGQARVYRFETDEGDEVPDTLSVFNVSAAPVTKKTGHTFLGWYDNAGFAGGPVTFPYFSKDGKTTLYAGWAIGSEGLYYEYTDATETSLSVRSYDGRDTAVTIPSVYDGKPVVKIGSHAFANNADITSVYIQGGAALIDDYAFEGCTALESVTFGENSVLERIGSRAFQNCISLAEIALPGSLKYINTEAFSGCAALGSVTFGENSVLDSIESEAFMDCTALSGIFIPDSVLYIGVDAFGGCSSLYGVTFGEGFGANPEYMYLSYWAFGDTPWFDNNRYSLYYGTIWMGYDALNNPYAGGYLVIMEGTTAIWHWAFWKATVFSSIRHLVVPESVVYIGEGAMADNSSVLTVHFGVRTLSECHLGADWNLGSDMNIIMSSDGTPRTYTFDTNGGEAVADAIDVLNIGTAPETAKAGYTLAGWYNNAGLEGGPVAFPYFSKDGKTTLYAAWEFGSAELLYEEWNGGGEYMVTGYTGSDDFVNIPAAYNGLPVTKIEELPWLTRQSYTFLGWYDNAACEGEPVSFPYLIDAATTLYAGWEYGSAGITYELINNDTEYAVSAYSGTDAVVNIPATHGGLPVTQIAEEAFRNKGLTAVNIPEGITYIGNNAFRNNSLQSVTIPASVIYLGSAAFSSNISLASVTFAEGFGSNLQSMTIGEASGIFFGSPWQDNIGGIMYFGPIAVLYFNYPGGPGGGFDDDGYIAVREGTTAVWRWAFGDRVTDFNVYNIAVPASVVFIGDYAFAYNNYALTIYFESSALPGYLGMNWNHEAGAVIMSSDGIERTYAFVTEYGSKDALEDVCRVTASDAAISYEGYTFLGWYDNADYENGPVAFPYFSKDGKTTLYAKWEFGTAELLYEVWHGGAEYMVTYYTGTDDLINIPAIKDGLPVTKIEELPGVTRQGHTFIGWYDNAECLGEPVTFPYLIDGATTLYAGWEYGSAGLVYEYTDDTETAYMIWYYEGTDRDVIIPAIHGGLPVVEIDFSAFQGNGNITSVSIPDSVTLIDTDAFNACTALASVIFGENSALAYIANRAFQNCTSLSEIVLPSSVEYIGIRAFGGCTALAGVTFGENSVLDCIDENAFNGCFALNSIVIPLGVTEIGHNAMFWPMTVYCETASMPLGWDAEFNGRSEDYSNVVWASDGIERTYAFVTEYGSKDALEDVYHVTASYAEIRYEGYTFLGWYDNADFDGEPVSFPYFSKYGKTVLYAGWEYGSAGITYELINNDTEYAVSAYSGTDAVVNIPATHNGLPVTQIAEEAFRNKGLTAVNIPEGITYIGDNAFKNNSLQSVTIPASVIYLGSAAFSSNILLASVTFAEGFGSNLQSMTIGEATGMFFDSPWQDNTGGILYFGPIAVFYFNYPGGPGGGFDDDGYIAVREGTTAVWHWAFGDRVTDFNVYNIAVPASVVFIGDYAFANNDYNLTIYFESAALPEYLGANWDYKAGTIIMSSDGIERTYTFVTEYGSKDALEDAYHVTASDAAISYEGYTFLGWYDNEDYENGPVAFPYFSKDGKTTLYAKWEPDSGPV